MAIGTTKGCVACRKSARTGAGLPLVQIMESIAQHAILYRCQKCGACWLENEHKWDVIPVEDARIDFPEAFAGKR